MDVEAAREDVPTKGDWLGGIWTQFEQMKIKHDKKHEKKHEGLGLNWKRARRPAGQVNFSHL